MLDTVRVKSTAISEQLAGAVAHSCDRRIGVRVATGEILYELTTGQLDGSYDHRVRVCVERREWVKPEGQAPQWRDCDPRIVVEGSVHKAILGHNVYGGPLDPGAAIRWLLSDVGRRLACDLPPVDDWTVERADWAEVYRLPSFEAVQEYIWRLNRAEFPRRKAHRYGSEGVYFPGTTTTPKLYHKGPEFYKHDRVRLQRWVRAMVPPGQRRVRVMDAAKQQLEAGRLGKLVDLAHCLLRVEVEVHSRKLEQDSASTVGTLSRDYLERLYDGELERLLREGRGDMETVRKSREVSARLEQVYGRRLGNVLFGTWMRLSALGEEVVRKGMTKPTFYRQRGQLQAAAVDWKGGDVRIVPAISLVPDGFAPIRRDPRRLAGEAPEVAHLLEPYRLVA